MADTEPTSATYLASQFAAVSREVFGVPPTAEAARAFAANAHRLPPSERGDFLSLVVLEGLEARAAGLLANERELVRVLDRVRHRLVRQARRALANRADSGAAGAAASPPSVTPSEVTAVQEQFRRTLATLSPAHLLLFEETMVRRQSVGRAAAALGVSSATAYRYFNEIRQAFADVLADLPRPNE